MPSVEIGRKAIKNEDSVTKKLDSFKYTNTHRLRVTGIHTSVTC